MEQEQSTTEGLLPAGEHLFCQRWLFANTFKSFAKAKQETGTRDINAVFDCGSDYAIARPSLL